MKVNALRPMFDKRRDGTTMHISMLLSSLLTMVLLAPLDSPISTRADALAKLSLSQGDEPRGAAPLIRLHSLLGELDDLNVLADVYSSLLYRRNTDDFVRVLAKRFMADVERARGRTVRAQELMDTLSSVQNWYVLGGFDNENKSGCDKDFGPESALNLQASYPAANRTLLWHVMPQKSFDGFVDLSPMLKPANDSVGYALTFFSAASETRAELFLGTSGPFRLFVNGAKVAVGNFDHHPKPDQDRVVINLRRGINRVLLKVCQSQGPFGFYVRAERPAGSRIGFENVLPPQVPPLERGSLPTGATLPSLVDVLARAVKLRPTDFSLRLDYATVLEFTQDFDRKAQESAQEAARAAQQLTDDVEAQLTAASLAVDGNKRTNFIQRALAIDAHHPFARGLWAQERLRAERPNDALVAAQSLVADFPLFSMGHLILIRSLSDLGRKAEARQAAELAFEKLHLVPSIAVEAASVSSRSERQAEALDRTRMVLALRYDDLNSRRALSAALLERGELDEAALQAQKVLSMDGFDQGTRLRLGEWLLMNTREAAAQVQFQAALALAPDDAEVFERVGKAYLRAGKTDAALEYLSKAMRLRPQNPALRDLLKTVRNEETLAPQNIFDLKALAKEAPKSSTADALILAEVEQVKVQPSGLASRFTQVVVKLYSQRGVDGHRQFPVTFAPERQELTIVKARILKPDGSVLESFGSEEYNRNEPWSGTYYDSRDRVTSFQQAAVGDVIELQYRLEDTAIENLLSDYWGDLQVVQGLFEKSHFRYRVEMPEGRPLYWNARGLPAWISAKTEKNGQTLVYRFEADAVPRLAAEPQMPGWSEMSAMLHLSTYENWDKVGRYYWGLVREQLVPNDEVKKTVNEVLKGIDRRDTQKVVAAIYGFVVTHTRYVALEFGIHGFKPYRVDTVLNRKFGDCKDKASLMVSMLKLANVDAKLVLLRTRELGRLSSEVASLAAFNHAIAFVPALKLFLDGTAEFHGTHELPSSDRLANYLMIEPEGVSEFRTTDQTLPQENTTRREAVFQVRSDGSAKATGVTTTSGQSAPDVRRRYETLGTRSTVFEEEWGQQYPGAKAKKISAENLGLEQSPNIRFEVELPRFAEASASELRFYPLGAPRTFTQAFASLPDRKTDTVFSGVWRSQTELTFELPPGFQWASLPQHDLTSPYGRLVVASRLEGKKLVVTEDMTLSQARVPAIETKAFRSWLIAVDQAYNTKISASK
jgi:cellulose synthase operon protein C